MNSTTETIPSANSTGAPYIAGNFAPLRSEVTSFDLEVIGRVPQELSGRFLRIGPNPIDQLDQVRLVRHHWFAGSGMAHGLRLRDGKAEWFRSRFVLDRDAARVLSRKPISPLIRRPIRLCSSFMGYCVSFQRGPACDNKY